jgi:CheY-like chemotaxis protein
MNGMIERVLLVAWKGSSATAWVETLKSGGYTVLLEDTTGERAWRTAKERGIDVVIIDGQKKPSHGRQTGHALRDTAKTRNIPIIWTNLDTEDAASVATEVKPDVTLAAPTDASSALAALQALAGSDGLVHHHDHDEDEAAEEAEPAPTGHIAPPRAAEPAPAPHLEEPEAEEPAEPVAKPARKPAPKATKKVAAAKAPSAKTSKSTKKPSASKAATKPPKPGPKSAVAKKPARAARTAKPSSK